MLFTAFESYFHVSQIDFRRFRKYSGFSFFPVLHRQEAGMSLRKQKGGMKK